MEWLIRLLVALLMGFLGISSSSSGVPPSGSSNTVRSPMLIESVEAVIMESFPMQINLIVKGQHPDGCDLPVIIEQARGENTIDVQIYRELPIDLMCAMMVVPYEATIQLDGGFEPGTYAITVNDFVLELEL